MVHGLVYVRSPKQITLNTDWSKSRINTIFALYLTLDNDRVTICKHCFQHSWVK